MYFAMLKQLRHDHTQLLDISPKYSYGLMEEERLQILSSITEVQKTVIRRNFIQNTLREVFRDGMTENLLMQFVELHAPEGVAEISTKHREVYDKRHTQITEKIEALQAEQVQTTEKVADQLASENNRFAD